MSGYKIFMVSGEASGDLHGGNLIKELRSIDPLLEFCGMGGEKMRSAGLKGMDIGEVAVVGISEVVKKIGQLFKAYRRLKLMLHQEKPDIAVFIDFPDFNLKLAREAKKSGISVVYYISPQVWAWRKGRVKKMARVVDKMLVIFPFEVPLYEKEGIYVEYVGHPLKDHIDCRISTHEARKILGIDEGPVVAILAGSRVEEVERHLPLMLKAAALIRKEIKSCSFVIPVADTLSDDVFVPFLNGLKFPVTPVKHRLYEALGASDAAMVVSGTATLEAALMQVPMVIIYRLSLLSYLIGRILVGRRAIGLPNIIMGKAVVKELIQEDASPEHIADEVLNIMRDKKKRALINEELESVNRYLGEGGASRRAAMAVYKQLTCGAGV